MTEILVKVGDKVEAEQSLITVEGDKASMEVPAPFAGTVKEIKVNVGDIIESIWNNRFPPGTILPAERELSELIGVTRTTLREVLQRLARDGWLTIQHGKPTKVNNFWETSGLNVNNWSAGLTVGVFHDTCFIHLPFALFDI